MKKLIMIMVTCIMITGCSTTKMQETIEDVDKLPIKEGNTAELVDSNEIETVEEIPSLEDVDVNIVDEEVQILPLEISVNTLENTYNEEDVLLAHVKINYPIIQNELEVDGITKINQFFAESAQALYEENNTYASDNVELIKEEAIADNNSKDCYSEYLVTFEIKYNADGYLSVLEHFSEDNYGIDTPNAYSIGYIFDVQTGKRLAVSDVLEGTADEIDTLIGQTFMDSDRITEKVKKEYSEEILANTQYAEFYMDDKNMNFFYNPNTVATYSEGTLEAYIPLNTEHLFRINVSQ